MVVCRISLLDGTTFEPKGIDKNSTGQVVFDKVIQHLDLIETDYFGLTFRDKTGKKYWIDNTKKISNQVKGGIWVFEFQVKFYPPDPQSLKEDLTRYQLCLQVRVDIFNGRLPCSFVTYALLGSYTVQAELGDYEPVEYSRGVDYLKDFDFAPTQQVELLEKIAELHKYHKGQTPEEAESNFLENGKKLAMYGVDLHDVKDSENKPLVLGIHASGILVYKDRLRVNRFVWPKILKLEYKRNIFYVQTRPGLVDPKEKTFGFRLDNHKLAKRLWKICVEHHAFFRLKDVEGMNQGTMFPRFNTKFRYSGRTQAQAKRAAEAQSREAPHITRTAERRSLVKAKPLDMDEMENKRNQHGHPDEKDMYDKMKGDPTATAGLKGHPDQSQLDKDGKQMRGPGGEGEDRRDRQPGDGDKTEGMPGYEGDTSGLTEGGVLGAKGKKDKEDEKKRKKEEERRKKEEEKRRKEEEKERKRLEKDRKKKGDTTEDRADKMGDVDATETAINGHADPAELERQGGFAPGDYGMSAGDNKSIDRKMQFMPVVPPTVETRDKRSDSRMPFFQPAGESSTDDSGSLGRKGPPPVAKKPKGPGGYDSEEDRLLKTSGEPPTVQTESFKYTPNLDEIPMSTSKIPIVETKTHTVTYEKDGVPFETEDSVLISAHSVTTKSQTIDTTTYKTERDGIIETRVERKITVTSEDDDDIDHDRLLVQAIEAVTRMNPNMSVERIEHIKHLEADK